MKFKILGIIMMVSLNSECEEILFDDPDFKSNWVIVNDSVMGGRSSSSVSMENNIVTFQGQLSLENNGGFASVRHSLAQPISSQNKVSITVKGDNRRYQLRLRTNKNVDGIAYKVEFTAVDGQWKTLTFDRTEFTATYRGRTIDNAPPLNFGEVGQLSFLIADKQLEPFKLSLNQITFW